MLLPPSVRRKSHVLLGGADAAAPSNTREGRAEFGSVLFVGRLVRRKGVDDLIEAMVDVSSEVPGAHLTVVGDGPDRRRLEDLASSLGLGGVVSFRGTLRGKDLEVEYQRCAVFVLASKDVPEDAANEGLGLALIEAAMYGKPLVGTRHGGIPEVIKDGENGVLVAQDNPTDLAGAISGLLRDNEEASRLGANALRLAGQRFSWEAATSTLLSTYVS